MTAQAATSTVAVHEARLRTPGLCDATRPDAPASADPVPVKGEPSTPVAGDAVAHWLDWQCRMISGVHRGLVYVPLASQDGALTLAARWPSDTSESTVVSAFAHKAHALGRSLSSKAADDIGADEVLDFIAFPVDGPKGVEGVVVLAMEIRSDPQRKAVAQLLEWGAVWLREALPRLSGDSADNADLALNAVTILAADYPLSIGAHRLCNLFADAYACSRVALGEVCGMRVDLVALSDQVQFDRRHDRVSRVQAAMEECLDQEAGSCLPARLGSGHGLTRAHAAVMDLPKTAAVCSLPIIVDEQVCAVLTLIWDDEQKVDSTTVRHATTTLERCAPVLALKKRESRPVWRRFADSLAAMAARLFGAGHLKTKLMVATLIVSVLAIGLIQTDRRVAADAAVEGVTQRAIVAPVAGYLLSADARAGDHVEASQLLAAIDDRELLLEKRKWQGERDKYAREYQEALGARERAQIGIASARIAQAEAELKLIDERLARTKLYAPFAGTLVSGDLSRAVGAPLERGQRLFEIVPTDAYRVSLQVDEHDIAGIEVGQRGSLRLTGMPDRPIRFEVSRIVPLATAANGGNHFRVEATLIGRPDQLRPGMQGVAKVTTGRASLLHAWTDALVDRLRLWAWSIGF